MRTIVIAWAMGALGSVSLVALILTTAVRSLKAETFVWDDLMWVWGGATAAAYVMAILLAGSLMLRAWREL